MAVIIPDALLARTNLNAQEMQIELAVWLFQTQKVSLGKTAEVAEIPKYAFQHLLAQRQIPLHYGPDELAQDLATLATFSAR